MLGVAAIVVDDPNTRGDAAKLFAVLGDPTKKIETSPGNQQWVYMLEEPADDAASRPVLAKIKALGLGDGSGNNAVRYARLPCGVNNKRKYKRPFVVREIESHRKRRFRIEVIAKALGAEKASEPKGEGCPMNSEFSDEQLHEKVRSGESYHDPVMVLAARLAARGHDPDEIAEELRKLMNSCPRGTRRQESWQRSYDDIERFVDTAIKKYAPKNKRAMTDFVSYLPSHSYLFLPTMQLWPAGSVDACVPWRLVDEKRIRPSTVLDQDRPAHSMTWSPGDDTLIHGRVAIEGGWEQDPAATTINTYKPPIRREGVARKARRWVRHLELIYPQEHEHIADWLAFKVQRPGVKVNHALVLAGSPGIGKDTILDPVRYAVGVANYKVVGPKALTGDFNPHVKSVVLHVSEARDLGPTDRFALYESNKDLIAAPPATIRVNEKNLREHYVFNVLGVIFTTNHAVDGLYLPPDDRRHYVASSPVSKEQFAEDYWLEFWRWYAQGGTWHVVAWLRERDVSGFDPGAPPKRTDAWRTMVQGGASSEDLDLQAAVEAMKHPAALTLEMLRAKANGELLEFLQSRDTRKAVKHRLAAIGYYPFSNPDSKSGLWKLGGEYAQVYARNDVSRNDAFKAIDEIRRHARRSRRKEDHDDLL
jgi:hypothetical protein